MKKKKNRKKKSKKRKVIKLKKNTRFSKLNRKIKKRRTRVIRKKIKNRQKRKIKQKRIRILPQQKSESLILKTIRIQETIKSKFTFKFNINFLAIDRVIAKFFQKIDQKIIEYREIRADEKRRIKLEKLEIAQQQKILLQKQKKEDEENKLKLKQKELKEEERLEKERAKDIKIFLRKEQALIRKEQAERQKKFLQEIKLEQQIEKFRIREIKELEKLEKVALKEKRDDYSGLQERIEKLKKKYQQLRDQKIRERVEALGVEIQEGDDRETLLKKEREYNVARQKIELALESFYRSANSLVFQLNKRYITKHMSILRCIDRRFETGEIFIKWDETIDDEWLILIYIKDNSPDKGIIIEDKSNEEKNFSYEYKPSEIFKASDMMVDSLTQLIAKKRSKKN
jgi:hypothetical protein